jgi:hypothetical protein
MFHKLRGISSCGSRGSEPAPLAPAMTAESETINPSPHAIHISNVRRSLTKLPYKPGSNAQSVSIIIMNAKGATNSVDLYRVRIYPAQYAQRNIPSAICLALSTPRLSSPHVVSLATPEREGLQ